MSRSNKLNQEELNNMINGFQKSRVILTAFELGIFTLLSNTKKSAKEIAKNRNIDTDPLERLMNALCSLELLEKKNEKFSNLPIAESFLVKGKPDFLSRIYHSINLWDSWSSLTQIVKTGTVPHQTQIIDKDEDWLRNFIGAMHNRAKKTAPGTVKKIDLDGVNSILDIGGGSGVFAMAFKTRKKELNVSVFDLPNVILLTKEHIEKEGFEGKIHTIAGDYLKDDIGTGYDLIFLSAIIHSNSFEKNQKLILKCASALNKNGRILIDDFIMNEDKTSPMRGAIFSINMLVGTKSGTTYSENEIKAWFDKANIRFISNEQTQFGTSQIIGQNR
ncbi:MAG: methyltransferase [Bacteroidota bacterium]